MEDSPSEAGVILALDLQTLTARQTAFDVEVDSNFDNQTFAAKATSAVDAALAQSAEVEGPVRSFTDLERDTEETNEANEDALEFVFGELVSNMV